MDFDIVMFPNIKRNPDAPFWLPPHVRNSVGEGPEKPFSLVKRFWNALKKFGKISGNITHFIIATGLILVFPVALEVIRANVAEMQNYEMGRILLG